MRPGLGPALFLSFLLSFTAQGKAGAGPLDHWGFAAAAQFGELNHQTGNPQRSAWSIYWRAQMFPSPAVGW